MDETTLTLLKVIEDKDTAIKSLTNKLEGYYTCTKSLLEIMNYNLVESQVSGVDINSYFFMEYKLRN